MSIPFHDGEIAIQTRAGVRAEADQVSRVLSNTLQPGAIKFLQTQQLAIAGTIAPDSCVWASLLTGSAGFIQTLDTQTIQITSFPIQNPKSKIQNLSTGSQLGLLVIDLSNRRRLRLNGYVLMQQDEILQIQIQQSFFNCPKYIQTRHLQTITIATSQPLETQTRLALSEADQKWINQADTFFIASAHPDAGADASHRGGYPGFIQAVDSHTIVFPDYSGNNMFQTLGNLAVNPRAGLLFVDFEQGHTLQLTGQATIHWDPERLTAFVEAQRLIQFSIERILETRNATPLHWQFGEYSPANPHPSLFGAVK